MEVVPADIIEEILVRLAVKSLMRFKCVSRRWCALIQSRRFIHRHYSHDTNQDRLVFETGEYVDDRFEEGHGDRVLPYFDKNIQHRIMGAVMGLLCGLSVFGEIVMFNPATHKVKRVPPLPFVSECWVFDLIFGFGLDPWSGDYKIVVFGGEAVWVYNSSSEYCWKRVEGSCSALKTVRNRDCRINGAFSNGVYYWLVMTMNGHGKGILGFDMMSEKFREIKVPDGLYYPEISAYGDSIAVMSRLDVWVMGEEGVWRRRWKLRRLWWPLFFWKGELMLVCNEGEGSRVQLIDLSTRKVTSIDDEFNDRVIIPFIPCPFCYKESLVSIQGEQDV